MNLFETKEWMIMLFNSRRLRALADLDEHRITKEQAAHEIALADNAKQIVEDYVDEKTKDNRLMNDPPSAMDFSL